MLRLFVSVILCATATGCVSSTPSVDAGAQVDAYAACNRRHALRYAKQAGDPYSLAIAAEASCPRERLALMYVYRDAYGPGTALRMVDGLAQNAIEGNTAIIARARS